MIKKREPDIKAIKGGMLIDGTGAEPIRNATVVIEGSKIKAVGKGAAIPESAEVMDAKGKTVMPGLIDAHMHFRGVKTNYRAKAELVRGPELRLIQSISEGKELLAMGFTMAKDCGGLNGIFLKKAEAEGILTGLPRIVAAGHLLCGTAGHIDYPFLPSECVDARTREHIDIKNTDLYGLVCDSVDECIKAVRHQLRVGADFVKICSGEFPSDSKTDFPEFSLEATRAIVQAAADAGLFVTAHNEGSIIGMKRSILGGVKTIDHAAFTNDEVVELAKQNGVIFVATLGLFRRLGLAEVPQHLRYAARKFGPWVEALFESYKRIHRTGAVLAVGSDYPWARFGLPASELEEFVKYCDFTPMEAIVAATKNGAMACFMGDKTGTIEPGKFADIIIVDGNPLADIKILQDVTKIKMVMLEGKVEVVR
ncbi:MAG: amidohydrolase family protein [Chloroflexi bacterium]|nr:amidohydrolase family protein [Chloroflexota bacterium]